MQTATCLGGRKAAALQPSLPDRFAENESLNELQKQMGISEKQVEKIYLKSTLFDLLPAQLRKFFSGEKNYMRAFHQYDITNYCLMEVNEKVRCHRYELGLLLDKIGSSFYKIFESILSSTLSLRNDLEKKYENIIKEYSNSIERIEKDKQAVDQNFNNLKKRYIVQENLYKITKLNQDSLQNEVVLLHDLLKKDVDKMMGHLTNLEQQQSKQQQGSQNKFDPSESMMSAVQNLGNVLVNFECEQGAKDNMLQTMGGLLKAMLKGSKRDAATQVDDGQLTWSTDQLFGRAGRALPEAEVDKQAANIPETLKDLKALQNRSNLDLAKSKEKELNQNQAVITNKKQAQQFSIQDNWNLPVTIIVLLENISKSNSHGDYLSATPDPLTPHCQAPSQAGARPCPVRRAGGRVW